MRELDSEGNMPHHQCSKCDKFTYGPHTGENPGKQITYVSPEGEMMDSAVVPESQRNVSHSMCPECSEEWMANYRQFAEERRRKREAESTGS